MNEKRNRNKDSKSLERRKAYRQLRAYTKSLPVDADLDEQAQIIYTRWPNYPPDRFLDTTARNKRWVRDALSGGDGWAARLLGNLGDPHFYSLHACELGLPPECEDPRNSYSKANVKCWKGAIEASLAPPLWWKLELGNRIHVHIIADRDAGLPEILRGGELIKRIADYEKLLLYLAKPNAEWNAHNFALYLHAKRRGHLPRLRGTIGVPNRKTWHGTAIDTECQS